MPHTTLEDTTADQKPVERTRPSGCLLRVYWMFLGNAVVAICAFSILQGEGTPVVPSLIYWLGVASLIAIRYIDIHSLHGNTADGQPATMKHWQRYALGVLGVSFVVWLVFLGFSYVGR